MRLRDDGRRWVSPTVIVQVAAPGLAPGVRTGFTATKKIGGAVIRNRVKRRMREAARQVTGTIEASCDIVLIGRSETATCRFTHLVRDLRWCLRRLEVLPHDGQKSCGPAA